MIRSAAIERIRRMANGGSQPSDDFPLSVGLVNSFFDDAIAIAAKANWNENIKVDNVGYVNSSFYSTFSKIAITPDDEFGVYNISLPSIPTALGKNDGISSASIVDKDGRVSKNVIILNLNQVSYFETMPLPNGIMGWNEGKLFKVKCSDTSLDGFTAKIRMVSSGASSDLNSEIDVPSEYYGVMTEYVMKMAGFTLQAKEDNSNDGIGQK